MDGLFAAQDRVYQVEVQGIIGHAWLHSFECLSETHDDQVTLLTIAADQAALRGLLNWLWDLNLTILSVSRIYAPHFGEGKTCNEKDG